MRLRFKSLSGVLLGFCSVSVALGQGMSDSHSTQPGVLLRVGHASSLSALALSPDGRYLATASMDKTVLIWEIESATEVRVLQHGAAVTAVAFVSDTWVATGTADGILLVWDIETGRIEQSGNVGNGIDRLYLSADGKELWGATQFNGVFAVSSSNLTAVARYENDSGVAVSKKVHSDGTYAIVRWSDKSALIEWWGASALTERGKPHQLEARITSGAVASEGRFLMLGAENGVVHRMSGLELADHVRYPGHRGAVAALDIASDGTKFVSAGQSDNTVLVRLADTGGQIQRIESAHGQLDKALVAFNGDGVFVATDENYSARLVSLSSRRDVNFQAQTTPVFKLQSSRDHRYLLTGEWYGAHLWDSTTGTAREFKLTGSASAAAISPRGTQVFTGESLPFDDSRYLIEKDIRTGKEVGRFPHRSSVTAAAYSPDRRWLATGEFSGTIHVWNTEAGREALTMSGHSGGITGLRFGQDSTLLSQGSDRTARVWSLDTGQESWREDASDNSEVFSPDGRLLAAWSGRLRILDVKTHKELRIIEGAWANFAFASDDTLLFVNERQSRLESWNSTRDETREIQEVREPQSAKVVPLTDTLALICEAGTATVVDWKTATVRHVFQNAACSLAGAPFVIVDAGGRNEVWNAVTATQRTRLPKGKRFDESSFAASADGRFLATTDSDFWIEDWDLNSGRLISRDKDSYRRYDSLRSGLPALAANGDRYFVSFESDETPQTAVNRWTLESASKPHRLFVQPYAVESIDVSPDGKHLVTCGGDASLRLIDADTGTVLVSKGNSCQDAKFSPNGALITTTALNYNGPAQVWTADLRRRLPGLDYRPLNVTHAAVAEMGTMMLTLEGNHELRLWDIRKGEEIRTLSAIGNNVIIRSVEFMLGGSLALAALDTGEIRSWKTSTGETGGQYIGHKGRISSIERAQNNNEVFLSAGDDGTVRVWNVFAAKPVRTVEQVPGGVSAATLSADGTVFLVGNVDGSVRVWEVASGRLLHSFNLPSAARAAAFSPGKDRVLLGCQDGIARLVKVATGQTESELRPKRPEAISSVYDLGDFLVTSTRSGTFLWRDTGERLDSFTGGAPVVESRIFIDSERNLSFLNAGQGVHIARLGPSGFNRDTLFQEQLSSVAASPDGQHIAAGFSSGWLRIWDIQSQSMTTNVRVGATSIDRLKYSASTAGVLLLAAGGKPQTWDVSTSKLLSVYPVPADVTDVAFAGATDQFVLSSSKDGQVRMFDRISGTELCSLIPGRNGQWLVVRPDGMFDGTDAIIKAVIGTRADTSSTQTASSDASVYQHHPALLADILDGRIPAPPRAVAAPVPTTTNPIRFDAVKSPDEVASLEKRSADTVPPQGMGLQLLVELFANLLETKARLEVNDGFQVETLPDGKIVVGTRALEQAFNGQSFASSIGLTAFIVAHESWHSRQASRYQFGDLDAEGHRQLECEADVLGTIDAVKIVTSLGSSRESTEAYVAVRESQKLVAAMSSLEAGDSSHPTRQQRQWAVEFGNARFAARVVKDETALATLDRRFDARGIGNDESWARNVCRRLLNHKLANQADVAVSLRNERRIGDRWEAEVVYRNLASRPLQISAHVRLVGTAFSVLTGAPYPTTANIDGHVISFTLAPGAERVEPVLFASVELPTERFRASGILYSSIQQENWMSVESTDSDTDRPAVGPTKTASPTSRTATCVDVGGSGTLTQQQRELGAFLFRAAAHASDGFQRLRLGNAISLSVPTTSADGYAADIRLPGARDAIITVDPAGEASLDVTLGTNLTRTEADDLFKATVDRLHGLCTASRFDATNLPNADFAIQAITIPDFATDAEVRLVLVEFKNPAMSTVTLTVQAKKRQ